MESFLGEYLTEPKAHVVFRKSGASVPLAASQIVLDLKTQLLYSRSEFFLMRPMSIRTIF